MSETYVALAVVLGIALNGERIEKHQMTGIIIAIASVIFGIAVMESESIDGNMSPIGGLLAVVIALVFAVATVITRHYAHVEMVPAVALAQPKPDPAPGYPSKPIRWIVPFTPGGSNDVIGRLIAAKMSDAWGQQVVVDNRGGAGGTASAGTVGTVNTGGGAGGPSNSASPANQGVAGGSGIVIISVPTANYTGTTTGSPTVTTNGSNTVLKYTSSGTYTA